jgi:hypothetical protein
MRQIERSGGAAGRLWGQALDHHAHHGPLHPRLVVFGLAFVVNGQPAALAKPREGPLHDPSAGQDLKVVDPLAFVDDLDGQGEDLLAQVTSLPA